MNFVVHSKERPEKSAEPAIRTEVEPLRTDRLCTKYCSTINVF